MWKRFQLRKMVNKHEREKLLNESDMQSLMYLKKAVEPAELIEYSRGTGKEDAKYADWLGVGYVKNMEEAKYINSIEFGKFIFGVTSFPLFQELRKEFERDDVILFKNCIKKHEVLEFCSIIQQLQDLTYKNIVVCDASMNIPTIDWDGLTHMLSEKDVVILPHHLLEIKDYKLYSNKNKRHYLCQNKLYYVSSFDTGFDMDENPASYTIHTPVKFVKMNQVFATKLDTFMGLEISNYIFDPDQSMFYSLLTTKKCIFLTSPNKFSVILKK